MTTNSLVSWDLNTTVWGMMKEQASLLVKSGYLPQSIKTPEQAVTIMLKGRELGIPPMQAFAQISVINGKPALGAELMLARIYERYPDADIQIVKREADGCTIKARRSKKREYTEFSFTPEDAKRAGVLSKGSWQSYPKAMYFWRAVSDMARALWPECLAGVSHTPEELGAEVDEEGQVISIEPIKNAAPKLAEAPKSEAKEAEPIIYYDGETRELKNALFTIAKKLGVTDVDQLKALNEAMKGEEMGILEQKARMWLEGMR